MTSPAPITDGHRRAEFRAWVRLHHPDVGGDPDAFAAGLAAWQHRLDSRQGPPQLVFFRRPSRNPIALLRRLIAHRRPPPRVH